MLARAFRLFGLALLTAACTSPESDQQGAVGGQAATTRMMSDGLTLDLRNSERDLAMLQDSIYRFLGDPSAAPLRRARARWDEYRREECDAMRDVFARGTLSPLAQMDCMLALADTRRRFLSDQYDFMRPARRGPRTLP